MKIKFQEIPPLDFISGNFRLWDENWLLLTCGDFSLGKYNAMVVSWGSFGILWNKPMAMVVVRPTRHTFEFINAYETFSLCVFSEKYRPALNLLGSTSGRDSDKIKASDLTPTASLSIAAPIFKEAELVFECRKMYWEDLDPKHFLDADIEKNYPEKDYHRMVLGEVVRIFGDKQKYSREK